MQNTTRKTLKNHKTMPKMAQLGRNRLKTQSSGVFSSFPEIRAVLEGSCQISLKIPENQLMGPTLGAKKNCIPCGIELGAHSGTDGPRWPCRWKRVRSTLTIEVFVHPENLPYSSSSVRGWVIRLGFVWRCGRTWSAPSLGMLGHVQERKNLPWSLWVRRVVKGESGHYVEFT